MQVDIVDALDWSGALERAHALNFADTQGPMTFCVHAARRIIWSKENGQSQIALFIWTVRI